MPLTVEQITDILGARTFDTFVGEIENEWFDAKGEPYIVTTDAAKREMAKDVCAFANAGGGYILIGLRTRQSAVHHGDEVEEVRLIREDKVNAKQYTDILDTWCYPRVEGLAVQFHPSPSDASKGLFAIVIPRQRDDAKPFLIVRSIDGTRRIETMFGYAERKRDVNVCLEVKDLQRALKAGLSFENRIEARFDRIENLLTDVITKSETATDAGETSHLLDERIESALKGGKGGTGT